MNMTFKTLAAMCALALGLTGCTNDSGSSSEEGTSTVENPKSTMPPVSGIEPMKEAEIVSSTNCKITLSNEEIKCEGSGAKVSENTISITSGGVYELTGKSTDIKILIEADNAEVTLVLNGAEISSTSGSVIECESAKLFTICSVANTNNVISDCANYSFAEGKDEPDAAVFSRSDTVITGSGGLSINGLYKDAVKCKDGLSISCGKLDIRSVDDGITGKDYAVIYNGEISVKSGGDGIKSTNSEDEGRGYITIADGTIDVESQTDAIQAETYLTISGGKFSVKAGGDAADEEISASSGGLFDRDFRGRLKFDTGSASTSSDEQSDSCKGLKSGGNISISGGEFNIISADDSIHSNGSVIIDDGTFQLSSCDDGIHADESLEINGGTIDVIKSYEGLEGKNITINGGVINVKAVDDGLNAAGGDNGSFFGFGSSDEYYICISGGEITVDADGDGIDSNGTIAQSGGSLTIFGPTDNANGAIDYEKSYALSGGVLIALGSQGMAQAPSALSQPCLSVKSSVDAGSILEVRNSDGSTILSVTTSKKCQSLIFSCDAIVSGESYSIYCNNSLVKTVTASDGVSGDGASGNGFGGGRFNRDENDSPNNPNNNNDKNDNRNDNNRPNGRR